MKKEDLIPGEYYFFNESYLHWTKAPTEETGITKILNIFPVGPWLTTNTLFAAGAYFHLDSEQHTRYIVRPATDHERKTFIMKTEIK